MEFLPDLRIGWLNGWLPLALYLAGLVLSVAPFRPEARARLFADPKGRLPPLRRLVRGLGQLAMFAHIGLLVFTPFTRNTQVWLAGAGLYLAGLACVMTALHVFGRAPAGQVIMAGPYRWSRNPQWVGLALVLAGAAIMTGSGLGLGIVGLVVVVYHQQIRAEEAACLEQYGERFQAYLGQVPRYFWRF